ncbi:M20 family metallopeptidase [Leucobacter sp. wl10]|uniref:M20 metallopeptidase family protein n=1 Tax=Leucobacter sp. wl10 TaxID=2304677 RepID=UPI001968C44D|nr:M20 family metallopeptidase [Leucobacter sp. wl10]
MIREAFAARLTELTLARVPAAVLDRQALHRAPELSGLERATAAWIAERMPVPMEVVAGTGRIGRIGPRSGPAIALRAELDALPVVEATGVPFASKNGAMHACGHDVHQAALIAVSRAVADLAAESDLPYAFVPLLQPREEAYPSGALDIVRSGVLAQQEVAAVVAAHVHPRLPVGCVATGKGPTNAAADEITVTVRGRGGHGAYPHEATNPIPVLSQMVVGLNEVLRRTVSPMRPTLFTVGRISAGEIANVIPESGSFAGTLRTMDRDDRVEVHAAIRNYIEGQALAHGVTAEVAITGGEPVLENDADLVDLVDARLQSAGLEIGEPMRSCGADDFSFFSEELPGLMAFVGVETSGADPQPGLHHASFLPDEGSVRRLALVLVSGYLGACDLLDARTGTGGDEAGSIRSEERVDA